VSLGADTHCWYGYIYTASCSQTPLSEHLSLDLKGIEAQIAPNFKPINDVHINLPSGGGSHFILLKQLTPRSKISLKYKIDPWLPSHQELYDLALKQQFQS